MKITLKDRIWRISRLPIALLMPALIVGFAPRQCRSQHEAQSPECLGSAGRNGRPHTRLNEKSSESTADPPLGGTADGGGASHRNAGSSPPFWILRMTGAHQRGRSVRRCQPPVFLDRPENRPDLIKEPLIYSQIQYNSSTQVQHPGAYVYASTDSGRRRI